MLFWVVMARAGPDSCRNLVTQLLPSEGEARVQAMEWRKLLARRFTLEIACVSVPERGEVFDPEAFQEALCGSGPTK